MKTRYIRVDSLHPEKDKIENAAEYLKNGGLVAFPTETVYGLGADAFQPLAVKRIFEAKGRPQDNPLIVHIWSLKQLDKLVEDIPERAKILMENFWPGPLTIVLPRKKYIPAEVTAGLDTVGVRMPAHPVALELFKMADVPVAAPSANLSGKPSPTSGLHVLKDLAGRIDAVLDGGRTKVGVESTVVDCSGEKTLILRPGGITKEEMENVLGEKINIDPAISIDNKVKPRSPGMKYTHYAPDGEMYIVRGKFTDVVRKINHIVRQKHEEGNRVAVIAFEDTLSRINKQGILLSMGPRKNLTIAAAKIYGCLRKCDQLRVDFILAEGCPPQGMGLAIMNRLLKASGGRVIET